MKKLIAAIILSLSTIVNAHQIESIRDIPWTYTGVAGDLLQEHEVQLVIQELLSTTTEETTFGKKIKIRSKLIYLLTVQKILSLQTLIFTFPMAQNLTRYF